MLESNSGTLFLCILMVLCLGMSRGWRGTPIFDASCSLIYIN